MNVSDALLETLQDAGAERLYGIPGDAINEIVDAIRRQDRLRFVQVRHEEAGALAASAEAKLTGRLGVCVGTAGPGAVHLLNGLYDAKLDSAPVLAITGQVETRFRGSRYHQEVDLHALFHDVAVFNETIMDPAQMPRLAVEACQAALGRQGVAHLCIPADVAGRGVPSGGSRVRFVSSRSRSVPSAEELDRATSLLADCRAPTILAGWGCRDAKRELLAFAESLAAPIVTTLRAKDLVPDDHPLHVGGLGLLGTKGGLEAVEHCDLLVLVGTDFPYLDFYPDGVRAIQIDVDAARLGRRHPVEVGLAGHAAPTLAALTRGTRAAGGQAHLAHVRAVVERERHGREEEESPADPPLRPQAVAAAVSRHARGDTIFVCDTGAVTVWGARHVHLHGTQRFVLSSSLATMGFALPGALGAQLAFPERPVVAIAGDGGLAMQLGDFLTAIKYRLPVKIVVFNNAKLGLIQMEQEVAGLPESETDLQDLDYGAFAELCGGRGARVRTAEELERALTEAFESGEPWIVDVEVHSDELTMPPRIEVGQALGFGIAKVKELLQPAAERSGEGR
ncbi:MAG: thiamine pyrophosphate-binding protein [bacterium]